MAVFGNMVTAEAEGTAIQNSVAYCCRGDGARLLSEVIRIRGRSLDLQVFEETRGLKVGDMVDLQEGMLEVELAPGLLGQIYDGLQNPLAELAEQIGVHLLPGHYLAPMDYEAKWLFTPTVAAGDTLEAGETLGTVPEGIFDHRIMVPFDWEGVWTVESIVGEGEHTIKDEIAVMVGPDGEKRPATMTQRWPVKMPLNCSRRRLLPTEPLTTKVRIVDSMFPVVRGGTYCIPGPFGAGKTVLQQITSRHADVDVVVREFPELIDPRTGKSLMERTIIICNTSSMPVAAREASVYTGVTLAEYYRQMGLNVLLLADSTSRWAQAMRELSGRLEEIPGEEAFPAYLESRIAGFYERAGCVELKDGSIGSITIGGTVSPAGGNFEEPVTQGTLKVVGAFHGLSRARSDARRYPAIDPLDSWSTYPGVISPEKMAAARSLLRTGNEIKQMMAVVGEEGTSVDDFTTMLKAEFFDNVYLQQNAFDETDGATPADRQRLVFDTIMQVLEMDFEFEDRDQAREVMVVGTDLFRTWNYAPADSDEFKQIAGEVEQFIAKKGRVA